MTNQHRNMTEAGNRVTVRMASLFSVSKLLRGLIGLPRQTLSPATAAIAPSIAAPTTISQPRGFTAMVATLKSGETNGLPRPSSPASDTSQDLSPRRWLDGHRVPGVAVPAIEVLRGQSRRDEGG